MYKKTVFGIMLILLLVGLFSLAINVKPVKSAWTGTVYIRADGSIDPPDAPITTHDNITYTLTDNIMSSAYGIVIEKENIKLNGSNYVIKGNGNSPFAGIFIGQKRNITIVNVNITNFYYGILIQYELTDKTFASNCSVMGNDLRNNEYGIYLERVCSNSIVKNHLVDNGQAIKLMCSTRNEISLNYLANNVRDINLWESDDNEINGNICIDSVYGIEFSSNSNHNDVFENTIVRSEWHGISFTDSGDNRIFHNNFWYNGLKPGSLDCINLWDDGYPSGGNFWSDYEGVDIYSGPYQNETGSDGIADAPYIIDENNKDRYPLMSPYKTYYTINWTGTIYIRTDGRVEPPDAPIVTNDNVTYRLIADINFNTTGIIVERDNIIIDGAGHLLAGPTSSTGILLSEVNNVTIKNINIKKFWCGISISSSSGNIIIGNNIFENGNGIHLWKQSNHNIVVGNNITFNGNGIGLYNYPSYNEIIGNNIVHNTANGVYLGKHSDNNLIIKNKILYNYVGIKLYDSSCNNKIIENTITGIGSYSWNAISAEDSSNNNVIIGNNFTNHEYTIRLWGSSNNFIYHNNFLNCRTAHFYVGPSGYVNNIWDNGYPSGGNYWSDYTGVDLYSGSYQNETGSDSSGDSPYVIDENNQDNYPLMGPFNSFDAGVWGGVAYTIDIISNSTISDFHFNPKEGPYLKFNVTGSDGTVGFCRVTIPKQFLWAKENEWNVTVNGNQVNYSAFLDENNTYLYFTYQHSTKTVTITGTNVITLYTLNITSTDGGTTDPPPGTYNYASGTTVDVTAVPDIGYSFDYWLLDGEVKTENPITITMDSNHTLEAYFIDDIKPNISDPWQDPPPDNVQPNQNVTVWVNVTDYGSGIKNVTLWYSLDNGTTWEPPVNMTALPIPSDATITYEATIPGYENCTWITYKIIVYDNAGNNATKDNNGYYYKYHIIPEFPSITILLLMLIVISIIVSVKRKVLRRKFPI